MNLDYILEKIKKEGIESLTKEEKDFLNNYDEKKEEKTKSTNDSFNQMFSDNILGDGLSDFFKKLSKEFLLNSIKEGKLFDPKDVWNKLSDETIKKFTGGNIPSYQAIDRNTDIKFSNFIKELSDIIKEGSIKYIEKTEIEDILNNGNDPIKFKELQIKIAEYIKNEDLKEISKKYNVPFEEIKKMLFTWR